jgi:hypothetical protein
VRRVGVEGCYVHTYIRIHKVYLLPPLGQARLGLAELGGEPQAFVTPASPCRGVVGAPARQPEGGVEGLVVVGLV